MMAQEKFNFQSKESEYFDDDLDNEALDDFSDEYDDDERYTDGENRRTHNYSGSGQNFDLSDDSRLRKDHHNQLERKRRASIKSSYTELRESIPSLRDNKASRSVILQKAVEYLDELSRRNSDHMACVDHFTAENASLEAKCRDMENQVHMLLRQQRNINNGSYGSNMFIENSSNIQQRISRTSGSSTGSTSQPHSVNPSLFPITTATESRYSNGGGGSSSSGNEEESVSNERSSSTGSGAIGTNGSNISPTGDSLTTTEVVNRSCSVGIVSSGSLSSSNTSSLVNTPASTCPSISIAAASTSAATIISTVATVVTSSVCALNTTGSVSSITSSSSGSYSNSNAPSNLTRFNNSDLPEENDDDEDHVATPAKKWKRS